MLPRSRRISRSSPLTPYSRRTLTADRDIHPAVDDRRIYRISRAGEMNCVKGWTFQRFSAYMDQGPIQGERLQLDGGTRPGPSWSFLLNLPLRSGIAAMSGPAGYGAITEGISPKTMRAFPLVRSIGGRLLLAAKCMASDLNCQSRGTAALCIGSMDVGVMSWLPPISLRTTPGSRRQTSTSPSTSTGNPTKPIAEKSARRSRWSQTTDLQQAISTTE